MPARSFSGALSRAQREIWMAHQIHPASPKYNIAEFIEITGSIDEKRFESALKQAVKEADALNFCFAEQQGEPRRFFAGTDSWLMLTRDVSAESDPWIAAESWMREDLLRPVDLTTWPLFAFALFKTATDKFLWYQRFHYFVMDGYSRAIFAHRVAEIYTQLTRRSHRDDKKFSSYESHLCAEDAYLKSRQFSDDQKYWLERFADRSESTSLANALAPASDRFLRQTIDLSPSELHRLNTIGQADRASWKPAIIAAVAAYASRITGSADIILTLLVTGRTGAASRRVPGMMSNALPLRLTVHSRMTLSELVQQVSIEHRQLLRHQCYRGEDLVRDIRVGGRSRRPAGLMVNIIAFDYNLSFAGCPATVFNLSNGPIEDLSISVYQRDVRGLHIDLDANPALYTASELTRHQEHFRRLLLEVSAADPAQPIGSLNLIEAAEHRQILVEWNDTSHPVPQSTLPVLFEQQVAQSPHSVALVSGELSLTYEELNIRANRLAHYLIEIGVGPEDIVALAFERSIDLVVSVLAIMKAGAAYLPLAPNYPAERLSFMIQDAKPACIVATTALAARLPDRAAFLLLDIPATRTALAQSRNTDPTDRDRVRPLTSLNSAYVIYTSGSTGTPKGVVVTHTGIPSLAFSQIEHLEFNAQSRLLQFVSIGFDVALFDFCLGMLSGARLILAPGQLAPGEALAAYATKCGVTHLNFPVAALNMMPPESFSSCANLIVGGESASAQMVAQWSKGRRMISAYGPTETTVCATMSDPLIGAIVPPLGRPIWNTRVYVLDAAFEPAPIGVCGELYIAGAGLARGYLGNPGLTAERFVACPFGPPGTRMYRTGDLARWRADGVLEFLGRADQQIKIRGFRIEPNEIEAALTSIGGVAQAAVIPREIAGEVRLVAYLVAPPGKTLPASTELRANIGARLPDHMSPSHFVALEALPLTVTGKVDRLALAERNIAGEPSPLRLPRESQEAMLWRLFSELTGTADVGLDDNFFELGGSSFGAITLVARINKAIGSDLGVSVVFQWPTVRQLAAAISQKRCNLRSTDEIDHELPLVFLFPGIYGDEPQLGQFRTLLAGRVDFILIDYPGWDRMVASAFDFNAIVDACTRQMIARCRDAPILLAAYSFGGYVAFETARRLIQSQYRVDFLGLIDTPVNFPQTRSDATSYQSRILRYIIRTLRSSRSVQDIVAAFCQSFVNRCLEWAVHRWPTPIARIFFSSLIHLLPPGRAHSFKLRLCAALRIKHVFQWSPMPLDGPITLFRSDDPNLGSESTQGWAKVCSSLNVVPIGGNHLTILEQPQLNLLSGCFIEAIDAVQRSGTSMQESDLAPQRSLRETSW
jgi:nonribosomal peptide synthetase DhbF